MEELNFYYADKNYVEFLRQAEFEKRGFSKIPNINYGKDRRKKFFCGIILRINAFQYYCPVSSFKKKQECNNLIYVNNDITSSLRFNFMFPIPTSYTKKIIIDDMEIKSLEDLKYYSLVARELRYCQKHEDSIRKNAFKVYNKIISGKRPYLEPHACDFELLEQKCLEWQHIQQEKLKNGMLNYKELSLDNYIYTEDDFDEQDYDNSPSMKM